MENPFAAPSGLAEPEPEPDRPDYGGPWRHQDQVVAQAGHPWPERCARCNSPRVAFRRRLFRWRPSDWTFLGVLLGFWPYMVAYYLWTLWSSPPMAVRAPLCGRHTGEYLLGRAALAALTVVGITGAALASRAGQPDYLWVMLTCFLFIALAVSAGLRLVDVDGDRVIVRGLGPVYRGSLPELTVADERRFRTAEEPIVDEE
jgi:hypothetical protein